MSLIVPTLQAFFTDRPVRQLLRQSTQVASYRDTLRLLLSFVQATAPSSLNCDDLDEGLISSFLEHLQTDRNNSARTRNLRLTAIRSLLRYRPYAISSTPPSFSGSWPSRPGATRN